ncbi:MAG: ankyrin repeat domain-containing protein [Acidobacteria bacterium]|nr:ankyrin repeat domain-containing protein [Acidobacteriota bacterium]
MDTLQKTGLRGIVLFLLPIITGFILTIFRIKAVEEAFALGFLLYGLHSILFGVTFVGKKAREHAANLGYDTVFWSGWPARLAGVAFVILSGVIFLRSVTALVIGVWYPDTPVLKISLAMGTNPNSANLQGELPLMLASRQYSGQEVFRLLLAKGANPNTKDTSGKTPLMYVGNPDISSLLIKAGADVNARDNIGQTALMHSYNPEVDSLLIKSGAQVNIRDNEGSTALKQARERLSEYPSNATYREKVRVLESAGAIQ